MIQLFKYEDHAGKHRKPMREGAEGVSPRDENIDSAIAAEAQYFGLCFDDPEQKARMTAFMNKSKK